MQDRQESVESDKFSLSPSPVFMCKIFVLLANCCLLGDPLGDNVKIEGCTQRQVKGKEVLASDSTALALKLMDNSFDKTLLLE